ncbi:hypothetical protein E2C01_084136 [Portunus trituberculatus]|uniref:Uncharacterized protein n=1 Tax=Portunus trituberculatus TaxID=210409 RepID=A0A5B7IXG4_PORTR|nr:hypothetical protein [Portunus trituberculatus]
MMIVAAKDETKRDEKRRQRKRNTERMRYKERQTLRVRVAEGDGRGKPRERVRVSEEKGERREGMVREAKLSFLSPVGGRDGRYGSQRQANTECKVKIIRVTQFVS